REIVGDDQVLAELRLLTTSSAALDAAGAAHTSATVSARNDGGNGPHTGEREKDVELEEYPEEDEEDEEDKWIRKVKELAAALAAGLGDKAEEFLDVVERVDGAELCYHYERHLIALRSNAKRE